MKKSKDVIYEFVLQEIYANKENEQKIETAYVAEKLSMQRSNVSAILNELVKENKLVKSTTRPVYYSLPITDDENRKDACFDELIGKDGSLKNAVQLAKAAILYPKKSLSVLLSSKNGSGSTYFVSKMFAFAKASGVISNDAPYIRVNCRNYVNNIAELGEELYGGEDISKCSFFKAKGGMMFIDHADLLDAKQQSILFDYLETGKIYNEVNDAYIDCNNVILILSCEPQSTILSTHKIPVTIDLPELEERPLKEKFEMINHFFSLEANHANRTINVSQEAFIAFLLTNYPLNMRDMEFEIKKICANAYVRVVNDPEEEVNVVSHDLSPLLRSGLLKQKDMQEEINHLLEGRNSITYDAVEGYNDNSGLFMYSEIQKQYDELANRGVNSSSVESVINTHIGYLFKKYRYYYSTDDDNSIEQLSKIVEPSIIYVVSEIIQLAEKTLSREYKKNVFYGLCLHINSLYQQKERVQRADEEQIINIIQNYPQEYALCVRLADMMKESLKMEISMEEVVIMTGFFIETDEKEEGKPVLLYAFHGSNTATSLRDVTNNLTQCQNAYSYDLSLSTDTSVAMEELKSLIIRINRGHGVIVIYDMGSIKTILEQIANETNVKIRLICMPVTLIGIDVARKCSMDADIDYVYHNAQIELNNIKNNGEKLNEIIVTLCQTGEGGALQLKRYIDSYSKLRMKTFAFAVSNRAQLIKEIETLRQTYSIHCFVGTFDPKLFGIPFIGIDKMFEAPKEAIDRVLMFEPINNKRVSYAEVFANLENNLQHVSIALLKSVLPDVVDELITTFKLDGDVSMGLFVHIACMADRIVAKEPAEQLPNKEEIIERYPEDYKELTRIFRKFEKCLKIIVDDNEIATIISTINKI